MPELLEKLESRALTTDAEGVVTAAELLYVLKGVADESAAVTLAKNTIPEEFQELPRLSIALEPVHIDTFNLAACLWSVTVQYGTVEDAPIGEGPVFSFDTTGGTQHITQSKSTISKTAVSGVTAADHKGAIGVTKDSVEGVDITVPVYSFSETHTLTDEQVSTAYKGTLFGLTGKVNNGAFKGCAAGECLFLGASGSKRGSGDWEITFKFAASPNRTNIAVGDITVPAKKGWEYLWVQYQETVDGTAHRMVTRPIQANVERVYDEGDFAGLGIGV